MVFGSLSWVQVEIITPGDFIILEGGLSLASLSFSLSSDI